MPVNNALIKFKEPILILLHMFDIAYLPSCRIRYPDSVMLRLAFGIRAEHMGLQPSLVGGDRK